VNDSAASFNLFIFEMNQAEPTGPGEVREAGIQALDRHKDDWKYQAAAMDYTFQKATETWLIHRYEISEAYAFLFHKIIDEYAPKYLSAEGYRNFQRNRNENPVRIRYSEILADDGSEDQISQK